MKNDIMEFKIILLGNSGVGKTSILERFAYNKFNEEVLSTVGLNYVNKNITLNNGESINLKIWDTVGQEKFHSLSKSYFKNVDAVLFIFSIDDEKSFKNLKYWIELFSINNNGKRNIPLYLIENKNDLNRLVDEDEINDFLNEHDNLKFKSTSAKLEENNEIHELFQELGEILYNNDINGKENKDRQCSIRLTSPQKKEKTNYCICYSLE